MPQFWLEDIDPADAYLGSPSTTPNPENGVSKHSIIAVDFDDTLFQYVKPEEGPDYSGRPGSIGKPIWYNIAFILQHRQRGGKAILWTCREGEALKHALRVCLNYELEFDAVNANITTEDSANWPDCRKVKADMYLDDKAVKACSQNEWSEESARHFWGVK